MTLPQVIITERDGALGVLPPSAGRLTVFVGCANAGPLNQPATFARVPDLVAMFKDGPNVEAAAYYIATTGRPVVFVRAETTVEAEVGDITHTGTGTSVLTIDPLATAKPLDYFQYILRIDVGGVIGTEGIMYSFSYDGGYNFTASTPLGTEAQIILPSGVTLMLGVGTMMKGDTYTASSEGPTYDGPSLTAALSALGLSATVYDQVVLTGPLIGSMVGIADQFVATMRARGRMRSWLGGARMNEIGESLAEYSDEIGGSFGGVQTIHGAVTAGATRLTSALSGRYYRRPLLFGFTALQCNVSEEVNTADVNLGPVPGAAIMDRNGNPIEHDEALNPGLDDLRFVTARSWDGYPGVYITRPRLLSNETSDFQIIPYRRVLNLAEEALRSYFIRRLNKPIRVDTATGFILEADAVEIEGGALAVMRSVLLAKPKASDVQFSLSRIDNVLSTKTLTGVARVLPLAYPEFIELEVGFYNPAIATAA
jgi:hypothetical protein